MEYSETDLIAAAKKDRRAFALIYERHFDGVFGFIRLRVPSADDAGDLTAQTFMKAMLHLEKYEDRRLPFRAWLFRIALNEVNQFWRTMRSRAELRISPQLLEHLVAEVKTEVEPSNLLDLLVGGLNSLPEDQLLLVEMKFFEKRSYREMSEITGATENALKMRVSRIVATLRKELGEQE